MRALVAASWLPALLLIGALAYGHPNEKERERCPVKVQANATDTIGSRLTLSLKERIAKSPIYRLAGSNEAVVGIIRTVSIDLAEAEMSGIVSVIAVELFVNDVDHTCRAPKLFVVKLGADKVAAEAETILADLDKAISEVHTRCGPTP
jgi:hypothetical protein